MEEKKSIKNSVLEKIKSGQAAMKPKWHFVLKAVLIGIGFVIFILLTLFVMSLIIFVLHDNGVWFVPAFGMRGIGRFIVSIPWLLVLACIAFVVVLEILVRKYSFAYRRPFLYSIIGIIALVVVGGIGVSTTRMHDNFSRLAMERRLPFAGPIYQGFRTQRPADVYPGTVIEITGDGFFIRDKSNETFRVSVSRMTRFPFGSEIVVGDEIVVMGDLKDGVIYAFGIRTIGDKIPFPQGSR
ncbi:MAG: hypothetical protein AB1333_04040 [Patescibacteria group bacterium]